MKSAIRNARSGEPIVGGKGLIVRSGRIGLQFVMENIPRNGVAIKIREERGKSKSYFSRGDESAVEGIKGRGITEKT